MSPRLNPKGYLLFSLALYGSLTYGAPFDCTKSLAAQGVRATFFKGYRVFPEGAREPFEDLINGRPARYLGKGGDGVVIRVVVSENFQRDMKSYFDRKSFEVDRDFLEVAAGFSQGGDRFRTLSNLTVEDSENRLIYDAVKGHRLDWVLKQLFESDPTMAFELIRLFNLRSDNLAVDFRAKGWAVHEEEEPGPYREYDINRPGELQDFIKPEPINVIVDIRNLEMTLIDPG